MEGRLILVAEDPEAGRNCPRPIVRSDATSSRQTGCWSLHDSCKVI